MYKNYKRKSVNGLSIIMFTFTVIGNTASFTSILVFSDDPEYIFKNIPWLVGSSGTVTSDLIMLYQFYTYKDTI